MTWTKLGTEYADQCADVDLSDAAFRTHTEALSYLYKTERYDCTFNKAAIRRFATSKDATTAIQELVDHGFWKVLSDRYLVVHHGEVVQESLDAQQAKRERDKAAQQRAREKKARVAEDAPPERDVSDRVSADTRQTDRQTNRLLGPSIKTTCDHGVPNGQQDEPWASEQGQLVCSDCTRERRGA